MTRVNVAALKSGLSKFLEIVKNGEEVIITSHGTEVAKLIPLEKKSVTYLDWANYLAKHRPIKPLKKGISSGKLIRQIRDEDE